MSPALWRYGTPAIVLHWALAALIVFMASLGWWMMTVEHEPGGRRWIDLHVSVGLVVAALVLLRVVWRAFHRPAPLPPGLPDWQRGLSQIVQWLLYACMVLVPATGIVGASYRKSGIGFFGMHLPRWVSPDHDTAQRFFHLHEILVWTLVILAALHSLAGLWHLVVDRDGVFARMWPRGRHVR
ncbi:MAG TPA: cytochrome b [Ramlibacter sp.]|uniref:cytochrome b n=1 Tax=Ramlibacter sp. TaxID=1917967 RepID=UPI002CC51853|nr:cytochrome b [Ramlibacter sp.]HVZ43401.1 cytochrome b [Ramlibacter sp.]